MWDDLLVSMLLFKRLVTDFFFFCPIFFINDQSWLFVLSYLLSFFDCFFFCIKMVACLFCPFRFHDPLFFLIFYDHIWIKQFSGTRIRIVFIRLAWIFSFSKVRFSDSLASSSHFFAWSMAIGIARLSGYPSSNSAFAMSIAFFLSVYLSFSLMQESPSCSMAY